MEFLALFAFVILAIFVVLAVVVFRLLKPSAGNKSQPTDDDWDAEVIHHLKLAGSDLSKPHTIDFFLYFPTYDQATAAGTVLSEWGFEVTVEQAASGNQWVCLTKKEMVPELAALQQIRQDFDTLCREQEGDYDGWGAPVVT